MINKKVIIHEVGPRDGLQVEKGVVPLDEKIRWIDGLMKSGIDIIQLGSFVNPEKVPQMADTDKLFAHYSKADHKEADVILSGLVLNEKGLERGMACGVDMFCMGVSASETHSRKNTGMSPAEALGRIIPMAKSAVSSGKRVQVSVQSAFGCGFEGPISQETVLRIVKEYLAAGLINISLADTAGHANPFQVEELYHAIRELEPKVELACHFHNTYGLGLANCYAALKAGVTSFESAFGGLGGCPFTKLPAGNVSTEDLVHSLQRMGYRKDIRLSVLLDVARQVAAFFNRDLPGLILKSGSIVDFKKNERKEAI
ncbi:Isopropylmalate/homocitrate/citramalate synthase [Candidatus Zixiibacteriota bacterium]|nr:Isopropylmalate/homocitrate/citramalate synthase [candidate division Zixibacteria bacterium]